MENSAAFPLYVPRAFLPSADEMPPTPVLDLSSYSRLSEADYAPPSFVLGTSLSDPLGLNDSEPSPASIEPAAGEEQPQTPFLHDTESRVPLLPDATPQVQVQAAVAEAQVPSYQFPGYVYAPWQCQYPGQWPGVLYDQFPWINQYPPYGFNPWLNPYMN